MKIAFIALPQPGDSEVARIAPPLPLGYIASLLEQQRHIVRIYDLALRHSLPLASALAPLRTFRPHIIVIATADQGAAASVEAALAGSDAAIVHLCASLRDPLSGQMVAEALWRADQRTDNPNEQSVIFEALLALDHDLDSLPFPARHLLPLEQYPLFTLVGELQTTVLVAQQITATSIVPRHPALIIAELQSIIREHGIRHFLFSGPPITHNLAWLRSMLDHLAASDLGICWEAGARYERLDAALLRRLRQAGCEVLCVEFSAGDILDSSTERAALSALVAQAHELGIGMRARIDLEPPYGAMPALVDVSATFGLDDVQFRVRHSFHADRERHVGDGLTLEDVAEMARSRYRSSRSRQFFIDRFGPQLGPMMWRIGRAGLLGRTWRRYATGGEDEALLC